MKSVLAAISILMFSLPAAAGISCINGKCFSCSGSMRCVNGNCTCDGKVVRGSGKSSGPCQGQKVRKHKNGGGMVAVTASVDAETFVSRNSAVCGYAKVIGKNSIENDSTINGRARVTQNSKISDTTVNGSAHIEASILEDSTINGSARIFDSELTDSTINGSSQVSDGSFVADSVLNGSAQVTNSSVSHSVLNGSSAVENRNISNKVLN